MNRIKNQLKKQVQKAKPSTKTAFSDAGQLTRRDFLKLGAGVMSVLAALELGGAGVLFLRSRSLEGKYGGEITAGQIDSFPNGSVTEFVDGNFFLVRSQEGGFLAVYRRCPHLGCTVNWVEDEERFYCPCHASSFDVYGDFDNQTVSRALDTFPVNFDDDMVIINTTKSLKREHFLPEQLAYQ